MVLEAFCAGLISGIYSSFLRGVLLQVSMPNGWFMLSTYIYLLIVVPGAIYQLKLLNHAMELYNQAEIGPIYSSSIILMHMLSGAVILNEQEFYTKSQLLALLGLSLVIILGIYLIARKPRILRARPVQLSDEDNSSRKLGTQLRMLESEITNI